MKEMVKLAKFIDFDNRKKVFYDNIYLEDYKLVVKYPLARGESKEVMVKLEKQESKDQIKVEKFDLTKYTYLLSHE